MEKHDRRKKMIETIGSLSESYCIDLGVRSYRYDGTCAPYWRADKTHFCFSTRYRNKLLKHEYVLNWHGMFTSNTESFSRYIVDRAVEMLEKKINEEKEKERDMTNEEKRNLVVGMVKEYVNGKNGIVSSVMHNEINRVTEFCFTDIACCYGDRKTKSIIHWDDVKNCYNVFKSIIDDFEKWLNGPKHEIRYDGFCRQVKMDPKAYKAVYDILKPKVEYNFSNQIKNIIFNPPATIVFWMDGTKTVVKAHGDDEYDPEKGMAMAFSKKFLGNEYEYYNVFKHWLKKWDKEFTVFKKVCLTSEDVIAPWKGVDLPKFELNLDKLKEFTRTTNDLIPDIQQAMYNSLNKNDTKDEGSDS